jgi:choline transport protein
MVIGVLTSLPWILAATSVIIDMNAVQTSFLPSLEVFYQATGSKSVATFLQAYLTFIYYSM